MLATLYPRANIERTSPSTGFKLGNGASVIIGSFNLTQKIYTIVDNRTIAFLVKNIGVL